LQFEQYIFNEVDNKCVKFKIEIFSIIFISLFSEAQLNSPEV